MEVGRGRDLDALRLSPVGRDEIRPRVPIRVNGLQALADGQEFRVVVAQEAGADVRGEIEEDVPVGVGAEWADGGSRSISVKVTGR